MTALTEGLTAGSYVIDGNHTEIGFVARHAMVTKVRGRFDHFKGSLTFGDSVETSSATATIQTASINTGSPDRDAHLKSPDFFDVEQFPTITFTSTSVTADGDDDFTLHGDLTINGVTNPVELEVEFGGAAVDPFGYHRAGFSAETEVNREDFGLTWNAALEAGGVLVSRKITLVMDISAIKQG